MLEQGGLLASWALPAEPTIGCVLNAEILKDHRLDFLDFEGPLDGDRGHVSRHDAGTYETLAEDAQRLVIRLRGKKVDARVTIVSVDRERAVAEIRFDRVAAE
jgi:hypothetical protein